MQIGTHSLAVANKAIWYGKPHNLISLPFLQPPLTATNTHTNKTIFPISIQNSVAQQQ
jgi:hypothetical protein